MFCKHDYEILDKTILESAYEQTKRRPVRTNENRRIRTSNMQAFFKKKLIILLKCSKCKKVKTIVRKNP